MAVSVILGLVYAIVRHGSRVERGSGSSADL